MAETPKVGPLPAEDLKDWGPAAPFASRLVFEEKPERTVVRLQWPLHVKPAMLERTFGLALRPLGRAVAMKGHIALLLGPTSLLLVSDSASAHRITAQFSLEMAATASRAVDISHGLVAIAARGTLARNLLSRLCPLDLHGSRFATGSVARTAVRGHGLTIHGTGPDSFDLYLERSMAMSLWQRLIIAARSILGEDAQQGGTASRFPR